MQDSAYNGRAGGFYTPRTIINFLEQRGGRKLAVSNDFTKFALWLPEKNVAVGGAESYQGDGKGWKLEIMLYSSDLGDIKDVKEMIEEGARLYGKENIHAVDSIGD